MEYQPVPWRLTFPSFREPNQKRAVTTAYKGGAKWAGQRGIEGKMAMVAVGASTVAVAGRHWQYSLEHVSGSRQHGGACILDLGRRVAVCCCAQRAETVANAPIAMKVSSGYIGCGSCKRQMGSAVGIEEGCR